LYRFDNFKRAFASLREAVESERELTQPGKEGCVKRFRTALELGWKTIRNFLEGEGVAPPVTTPAAVIRAAFEAGLISDGKVWMNALDARNKMSLTYDFSKFEQVIADISQHYLAAMDALRMFFLEKEAEHALPQSRPVPGPA
jgi:nucleotidyltransferase substrate binding protein (TIGR01987 family)